MGILGDRERSPQNLLKVQENKRLIVRKVKKNLALILNRKKNLNLVLKMNRNIVNGNLVRFYSTCMSVCICTTYVQMYS